MRREAASPPPVHDGQLADHLARRLDAAWESREAIAPLSESHGLDSTENAYAIQTRWSELRVERGEQLIGCKIGLTSRAMREQFGVNEPDYGSLWGSRYYPASKGRAQMPHDVFIQPRLEGELAFLLGSTLPRSRVTPVQVLAATTAVAVAVEVIDSRIEDWRIKLVDTIADNSSYGALTVGTWSSSLRRLDLRRVSMRIHRNGDPLVEGIGAASLGDPARAVAWLANKLGSFGAGLKPGDIVLSGSLGRAIPVRRGDALTVEVYGQPPLIVSFE